MLSEIGWLVIVWVIWTGIFVITVTLIRFTMHGQQEAVGEQELEITAARTGQSIADLRIATATSSAASGMTPAARWSFLRWPLRQGPPPTPPASAG